MNTSPTPPPGRPDPADLLALGLATEAGTAASSPPPASPAELAPEFPQLDILELLGRGGMGAVYKARQRDLDRIVALKILRPGLDADPGFAERFTREARALAQLNHPGIVTLYEFGKTSAGRYFILMEFVDGLNLRQLLAAGRLAPREALAIVPPLCDALQYAHDRGLIHRDIKPENILVDRLGRVKIADFGIAKLSSTSGSSGRSGERERPDSETIGHSTVGVGTPAYMAPEQRTTPDQVDHRADLYALGVVLYQMLTGELPAAGQLRPPSTRVQLDVRLDEIVLRALEKDPALRYAAAREFKTHVETVAQTEPPAAALPGKPAPEPPVKSPSAWTGFGLLYCAYATLLVVTSDRLPDLTASHFDGDGRANGWMPRTAYLLFIALLPLALGALFALSARSLRWLPPRYVSIPRRDHWLAPERRAATAAVFSRWMAGPACLLLVFFAELHLATLLANRSTPPHLSTGLLIGPVIGFLVALMVWIVGLVLRFAEPDAPPSKSRRQSFALSIAALLALTLPAAPLLSHFSAASLVFSVPLAKTETASAPRFHFGRTREITLPRSRPVAYDFDRECFVDYAPTPQSPHGIEASQQWHAEHGTDVFADPNSYLPGVLFLGTNLAEVSPNIWDATADAAASFSDQSGRGLKTFIPAPASGQPPTTRVYRTPQGGIILVQLLGATDAGDVHLRYKAILPSPNLPSDITGSNPTKPNLRIQMEATPVTYSELAPRILHLVSQSFPQAVINETNDHLEARSPSSDQSGEGFRLTLSRLTSPDPRQGKLPLSTHVANWNDFENAGFDQTRHQGVHITLHLGLKSPQPFQSALMSLIGLLHLPTETLTDDNHEHGTPLTLYTRPFLTQDDLTAAEKLPDETDRPRLLLSLSPSGSFQLNQLTQIALGRRIAIVLDGRVISAPLIRAELNTSHIELSGGLTDSETKRLLAAFPGPAPADYAKVVDQAHDWLRTVDQGDYEQSWLNASDSLRRAITQEAWQTALQKARGPTPALSVTRRLETLQSSETLPGAADRHYFILRFDTLLNNDATCAETLTLVQEPEGDWRVAGYVIRPRTTAEKEIVAQAQSWLADIDAGRFASSWNRASDSFHQAITNDQWCARLEAVRSPLGAVKIRLIDTTRTTTHLPGAPDGRYVIMTFNTAFEHKQTAVETVTFEQAKDGAWRSSGYFIK